MTSRLRTVVSASFKASMVKANDDWFNSLTKEQQEDYIEDHPNSKYAKDHHQKLKDDDAKDKENRIKEVKTHIGWLTEDIAEIEGDGDDASREIELLKSLKEELRDLTS